MPDLAATPSSPTLNLSCLHLVLRDGLCELVEQYSNHHVEQHHRRHQVISVVWRAAVTCLEPRLCNATKSTCLIYSIEPPRYQQKPYDLPLCVNITHMVKKAATPESISPGVSNKGRLI